MDTQTSNVIDSPFCKTCQSLLSMPNATFNGRKSVTYFTKEIHDASATGCRICTLIWEHLQTARSSNFQRNTPLTDIAMNLQCAMVLWSGAGELGERAKKISCMRLALKDKNPHFPSNFSIELGHLTTIDSQPAIQDNQKIIPVNTRPISANTGDEARLKIIDVWMENCLRNHPQCGKGRHNETSADVLPSRLIDVSDPCRVHLVSKEDSLQQPVRYATVSHRWHTDSMPKLLRTNLESLKRQIRLETLPPVFRDAVKLCYKLRINYLWIDALCLVQDDMADCQKEIQTMGDIYGQALCNFGAMAAADRAVGLFVEHDSPLCTAFPLVIQRQGEQIDCLAYSGRILRFLNDASLMKRGWVLQERLLSPRSIYFDDQIMWECNEILANEALPEGVPDDGRNIWGQSTPFKLARMLSSAIDEKVGLYRRWLELVQEYTQCVLTFEADVFPAISGLARRFSKILDDRYLAGLWEDDLIHGLLWKHIPLEGWDSQRSTDIYRETYQAPSWSWASVKVKLWYWLPWQCPERELVYFLNSGVTLAGTDPMGKITAGYIRLSGHLCPGCPRNSVWDDSCNANYAECYDDGYDEHGRRSTLGTFFLPLLYRLAYYAETCEAMLDIWMPPEITGLILEAVSDQPNTYKRVGMFQHPWGPDCSQEQSEKFPEFRYFDPFFFELQMITII